MAEKVKTKKVNERREKKTCLGRRADLGVKKR